MKADDLTGFWINPDGDVLFLQILDNLINGTFCDKPINGIINILDNKILFKLAVGKEIWMGFLEKEDKYKIKTLKLKNEEKIIEEELAKIY